MTRHLFFLLVLFLGVCACVRAQDTYQEISLPELMKRKLQGDQQMVILDVRTDAEYYDTASRGKQSNIGRIKGALHIPVQTLDKDPNAVKQLDNYRDKDIYLICSHSYRSRNASNILIRNGFTHVHNVRGGMTEWFRRYDELKDYMGPFYETSVKYNNYSPAQLADDLIAGRQPLLIGISSTPRYFWDSANKKFYDYFPAFKNALYFNANDSGAVLAAVQNAKNQRVVLFNLVNNGAAELADWLTQKGITGVSYLVGGPYYLYEYIRNKNLSEKTAGAFTPRSKIAFVSSTDVCKALRSAGNTVIIDLRADTAFTKVDKGIKFDYSHMKGTVNFYSGKGAPAFAKQFPDKSTTYCLMSLNGTTGLELADDLSRNGYKILWVLGGLQRFEWYTINLENFGCADVLVN